jgi:hypothetical protein
MCLRVIFHSLVCWSRRFKHSRYSPLNWVYSKSKCLWMCQVYFFQVQVWVIVWFITKIHNEVGQILSPSNPVSSGYKLMSVLTLWVSPLFSQKPTWFIFGANNAFIFLALSQFAFLPPTPVSLAHPNSPILSPSLTLTPLSSLSLSPSLTLTPLS